LRPPSHILIMERRDFLLTGCRACAALLAVPVLASLESCATSRPLALEPAEGSSTLDVPLSAFATSTTVHVPTKRLTDPLLVVKEPDGTYRALVLKCPHKGGPVLLKGQELECAWHGSLFSLDGAVMKGPANSGLKTFPA